MSPPNKAKWRRDKTLAELHEALVRQVQHLRTLAAAFDSGSEAAAELLATVVYTLCHDGGTNTRSLLNQLGIRGRMRFPDSSLDARSPSKVGSVIAGPPLCALGVREGRLRYVAPIPGADLASRLPRLQFPRWWDSTVYKARGLNLTRRTLVVGIRNQDGGGHIDDFIKDEAYDRLARFADHERWSPDGTIGNVQVSQEDGSRPDGNAHWVTMRQIAWELNEALIAEGL